MAKSWPLFLLLRLILKKIYVASEQRVVYRYAMLFHVTVSSRRRTYRCRHINKTRHDTIILLSGADKGARDDVNQSTVIFAAVGGHRDVNIFMNFGVFPYRQVQAQCYR